MYAEPHFYCLVKVYEKKTISKVRFTIIPSLKQTEVVVNIKLLIH